MRDIKFRAWNEVEEKMLNWYEFLDTNMKNTFIAPESTGLILMQYTGLNDKNGKEIYEGDIVAIQFQRATKTKNALIEYSKKYAAFIITHTKETKHENENLGDYQMQNFEVIGNIYDNPELLKEGE